LRVVHDPALAYTDGRALSVGTGAATTAREALTLLDTAWNGRTVTDPNPDTRSTASPSGAKRFAHLRSAT
jgi:hypothetical protein